MTPPEVGGPCLYVVSGQRSFSSPSSSSLPPVTETTGRGPVRALVLSQTRPWGPVTPWSPPQVSSVYTKGPDDPGFTLPPSSSGPVPDSRLKKITGTLRSTPPPPCRMSFRSPPTSVPFLIPRVPVTVPVNVPSPVSSSSTDTYTPVHPDATVDPTPSPTLRTPSSSGGLTHPGPSTGPSGPPSCTESGPQVLSLRTPGVTRWRPETVEKASRVVGGRVWMSE